MKDCKRPRTNQESDDFYQTPTDFPEKKIQRCCVFVKKLEQTVDKSIFFQCVGAIDSYVSRSLTYADVRNELVSILRNHEGLLQEFHQLLAHGRNSKNQNPRLDILAHIVELLDKVKALGKSVHHAVLDVLRSPDGDMEMLNKQLDEVLREDPSLKEEFKTFLIDSGFLKRERVLEVALAKPVMPSYRIRPEAEEGTGESITEVENASTVIAVGLKQHQKDS